MRLRPDHLDVPDRRRLAPGHPRYAEILAAHAVALAAGHATYVDAATGYEVFTARALADRGACCDSGCRHCPFTGA